MCSILLVWNMRAEAWVPPKPGSKYKSAKPPWGRILSYLGAAAILAGVADNSIYESRKPIEPTYPAHRPLGYVPVYVPANSMTPSDNMPPAGGTS